MLKCNCLLIIFFKVSAFSLFGQKALIIKGSGYVFREEPLPHTILLGNPESTSPVEIHSSLNVEGINYYKATGVFKRTNKRGESGSYSMICYIDEAQLPDSINKRLQEQLTTSPFIDVELFLYNIKEKKTLYNHGFFRSKDEIVNFNSYSDSYKLHKANLYTFIIPGKHDSLITSFSFKDTVSKRITLHIKKKKEKIRITSANQIEPGIYFSQLREKRMGSSKCDVRDEHKMQLSKAVWTGTCIEGYANGSGKLYEFTDIPRYAGEMKDGLINGYGRLYGDVITEGIWENGNLKQEKKVYYREMVISDTRYNYKYPGLIYEKPPLLNEDQLVDISGENYYKYLSADTTFSDKVMPSYQWPESCAEHIFRIKNASVSRFMRTTYITYFLVQCKNRNLIIISRLSSKGSVSWTLKGSSSLSSKVKDVINTGCGCQ